MYGNKGQALLIVMMLFATVITVVSVVSFRTSVDTQISTLQQSSVQTLTAAEAGIEKAIGEGLLAGNTYLFSDLNLSGLSGIDIENSTVTVNSNTGTDFVSPMIQKDQQYTFYLSEYDVENGTLSSPYTGQITVYYSSDSACNQSALELTIVHGNTPYQVTRYVADTGIRLNSATDNIGVSGTTSIEGTTYQCRTTQISLPADSRLLITRALFARTHIAMRGTTDLRPQGRYIISEAKSNQGGVEKKIQLFQSFPQIPVEFFATTL